MSARETLTPELRAEVLRLEDDLRARVASISPVQEAWRAEYDAAHAAGRTAAAWEAWVDERVTLAAVAWVLTTVFVRFCEDNSLVKPVWISGTRHREAIDAQQHFLRVTARSNADVTDREWLMQAVDYLKSLPATAGLVDDTSPMWLVTPSGDAATRLINFWRERDDSGALVRNLADSDLDTRFLGDIYQEISEDAKKRYALLQTPVFVEEFILDQTLEPALNDRPLEGFKMIDPTCGSGHFLLGGFRRLLDRWHKYAPALDERERVQRALDSVCGVDINPFAVAIARFRLTVAALQAAGIGALEDAPAFTYHLAAGDSLLHGLEQEELDLGAAHSVDRVAANFAYATENLSALRTILQSGQYDTVVGNPPYITVKDPWLNKLYRTLYSTCHMKYALSVPFMERFFGLARSGGRPGWVGQITSNSFMKREFGVPLIERFLPTKDLRIVVDSSGAYIPGHGTPTVILVGRESRPVGSMVRAVLGVRGEPEKPADPSKGLVWTSIVEHIDHDDWSNDWVTVTNLERRALAQHPWSLSGGGAVELKELIDANRSVVSDYASSIGFGVVTGDDEVYVSSDFVPHHWARWQVPSRPLVEGERVRDFAIKAPSVVAFPYVEGRAIDTGGPDNAFWPWRTQLDAASAFGATRGDRGMHWWEYYQLSWPRATAERLIAFAEVSSHNHFVFSKADQLFNRSAPVIQLRDGIPDSVIADLLGVLNSSTVCFWLRQVCGAKGGSGIGRGIQPEAWMERYNFNSSNVADIPLPRLAASGESAGLLEAAAELDAALIDGHSLGRATSRADLLRHRAAYERALGRMVALQEELDWSTYQRYSLTDEKLTYAGSELPELSVGERAFEVVLARRQQAGSERTAWFERHGSVPTVDLPSSWPVDYRELVQQRIDLIESNPLIRLLERPEYKRRWAVEPWEKVEERALRRWLLERLGRAEWWFDQAGRPTPKSVAVLADHVGRDDDFVAILQLWEGRPDVTVASALEKLLAQESVPFLAAHRYKESGLRKRSAWEATWAAQRRQDRGAYDPAPKEQGGDGPVPVPPKYTSADFARLEYWSHRGKLDVPRERFILYPAAGREGDASDVIGWGGWDHAQQALALATLVQSGEQQGWPEERLTPLVAGVAELLPWVEQWHAHPDSLYGGSSPADFFSSLLDTYMAKLGTTRESLAAWRPPAAARGRKAKS